MDEMLKNEILEDYLAHHGILGQKWGVRRFQNYDGSYTQKGLKRYKEAKEKYEDTKKRYKEGTASRGEVKVAKRQMNKTYKKLKTDKMADQGKELYSKGKTITSNSNVQSISIAAISVGTVVTNRLLSAYTDTRTALIGSAAVAVGATAVAAVLNGKTTYENKRLRAYYSHHS